MNKLTREDREAMMAFRQRVEAENIQRAVFDRLHQLDLVGRWFESSTLDVILASCKGVLKDLDRQGIINSKWDVKVKVEGHGGLNVTLVPPPEYIELQREVEALALRARDLSEPK